MRPSVVIVGALLLVSCATATTAQLTAPPLPPQLTTADHGPTIDSVPPRTIGASDTDFCHSYVGQIVQSQSIEEMMAPFERLGYKDEYENKISYKNRMGIVYSHFATTLIVEKSPENLSEYVRYNADTEKLIINKYSLRNKNLDSGILFAEGRPFAGAVSWQDIYNLQVWISSKDVTKSYYKATNGFGAETTVRVFDRHTRGLYEGITPRGQDLFGEGYNSSPLEIDLQPADARRIRSTFKVGWVFQLKAPYFASAVGNPTTASFAYPMEETQRLSVLIGDIRCALILDQSKVLAAIPTL